MLYQEFKLVMNTATARQEVEDTMLYQEFKLVMNTATARQEVEDTVQLFVLYEHDVATRRTKASKLV